MDPYVVPGESELFNIAVATRNGCRRILSDSAEDALSLLAVAAFQLQAAHVGGRIAFLANDGANTAVLEYIATDYGGLSTASINLSIRCSVTAVDLCAGALGRLSGLNNQTLEWDARKARRSRNDLQKKPASVDLGRLVPDFLSRIESETWLDIEELRHELTHRLYKRGLYGSTANPRKPTPLAFPRHIDFQHGAAGMLPLDKLTRAASGFAEETFRQFCANVQALE